MKNSNLLENWLEIHAHETESIQIIRNRPDHPEHIHTKFINPKVPDSTLEMGSVQVCAQAMSQSIHSGEESPALINLDSSLRSLRARFPSIPLMVESIPESYWQRSMAWMLGEYLAERDLPLWVDLSQQHPAIAAGWTRLLYSCGLASSRLLVVLPDGLHCDDVVILHSTGSWILKSQSDFSLNYYRFKQV